MLRKHSFLSHRESIDWLTVECPPKNLVHFLQSLEIIEALIFLIDLTALIMVKMQNSFLNRDSFIFLVHRGYIRVHSFVLIMIIRSCLLLLDIYPAANWHEREAYDMFGIKFTDHPNLKRILMWDDYPYFPFEKSFHLPE